MKKKSTVPTTKEIISSLLLWQRITTQSFNINEMCGKFYKEGSDMRIKNYPLLFKE